MEAGQPRTSPCLKGTSAACLNPEPSRAPDPAGIKNPGMLQTQWQVITSSPSPQWPSGQWVMISGS